MIIKKIKRGVVIQSFDTETQKFTKQEFIPDYPFTSVIWKTEGRLIDWKEVCDAVGVEPFLPLEMMQPWPLTS